MYHSIKLEDRNAHRLKAGVRSWSCVEVCFPGLNSVFLPFKQNFPYCCSLRHRDNWLGGVGGVWLEAKCLSYEFDWVSVKPRQRGLNDWLELLGPKPMQKWPDDDHGQTAATPWVSKRSSIICKLMRKWPYLSLDLLPQITFNEFYGLNPSFQVFYNSADIQFVISVSHKHIWRHI